MPRIVSTFLLILLVIGGAVILSIGAYSMLRGQYQPLEEREESARGEAQAIAAAEEAEERKHRP